MDQAAPGGRLGVDVLECLSPFLIHAERHGKRQVAVEELRSLDDPLEMLGLDPLHIANEGKLIAIVPSDDAIRALEAMRSASGGEQAAIIGEVLDGPEDMVLLKTEAGGSRVLDMLVGDPLPRIC